MLPVRADHSGEVTLSWFRLYKSQKKGTFPKIACEPVADSIAAGARLPGNAARAAALLRVHPVSSDLFFRCHRALLCSLAAVDALLKDSIQAALAITDQWSLESSLLMGHSQDFTALRRAEQLYVVERNKTLRVFEQTAPTNVEPIPDDIQAEINELRAKR